MVPPQSVTVILTGPTASGKTAIALELARRHPGRIELVNADSMVVYRGMDIGTAKPTRAELAEIPHHLVDVRDPDQPFTAGEFVREAHAAIQDVHSRGKLALIVGGTGFYLKALLYGLWEGPAADLALRARLEAIEPARLHERLMTVDPVSALRIGAADRYRLVRAIELLELTGRTPTELQAAQPERPDPRFELLIIDRASDELESRIAQRTSQMIQEGLVEETRALRERYPGARALSAVGYRETCAFLDGITPTGRKISPGTAGLEDEIRLATRQLVKRQRTWFRSLHSRLGGDSSWQELSGKDAQGGQSARDTFRLLEKRYASAGG
jgi:tRNA dimethylallyltransferase